MALTVSRRLICPVFKFVMVFACMEALVLFSALYIRIHFKFNGTELKHIVLI